MDGVLVRLDYVVLEVGIFGGWGFIFRLWRIFFLDSCGKRADYWHLVGNAHRFFARCARPKLYGGNFVLVMTMSAKGIN